MLRGTLAAAFLAVAALMPIRAAAAPPAPGDDATLLRVFLTDGTSLVSYGELARVGERVIFSMPAAATPNPPLHLVNLPADRVDWDRTNRYAATARTTHYIQTQAESDYTALSTDVAAALNEVARTSDAARRLAIVERARNMLADWPQSHYGYRQGEVRQMLSLLDEAIADLRAARGGGRFDLTLTAYVDPPAIVEPLLPPPDAKEAVEHVLIAARTVDSAAERTSLLATAVAAIDRDKALLPPDWAAATRAATQAEVQAELRLDRAYQGLAARTMIVAEYRAQAADVRGLERLLSAIPERDALLGGRRPDAINSLVTAVQAKLDVARRLQLERDRWAMRAPELRRYRVAIREPMNIFAQLRPALENIKALSGSSPATLTWVQSSVTRILKLVSAITPPQEVAAPHALIVSALQLASSSAGIRREAALAADLARAWDASSAAAGALMLDARARADIQTLVRVPQLR